MKKILAMALSLMMVLSIAACGGNGKSVPSDRDDNLISSQQEQPDDGGGNPSTSSSKDTSKETDWWTKPYHIKASRYDSIEDKTVDMEFLYDGEEFLLWNGNMGSYYHMYDGALWSHTMQKDDPSYHLDMESEYHDTLMEYICNGTTYPGSIILYYQSVTEEDPDLWTKAGRERVEGFDCTVYTAKNFFGEMKIWMDEHTGLVVKREAQEMNYETEKLEWKLDYVIHSYETGNIPAVADVYQLPNDNWKPIKEAEGAPELGEYDPACWITDNVSISFYIQYVEGSERNTLYTIRVLGDKALMISETPGQEPAMTLYEQTDSGVAAHSLLTMGDSKLDAVTEHEGETFETALPTILLIGGSFGSRIDKDEVSGAYQGKDTIAGRSCYRYSSGNQATNQSIWVDEELGIIMRSDMVTTMNGESRTTVFTVVTEVKYDALTEADVAVDLTQYEVAG
ncbi:hypothetical protein [Hungatella hathewayi]|uniref:hypothetical protein n=1 Tax=Hungatella hathewayi TaxID=154046 RepID=UPI0011DC8C88|nr:hypothetical protein [Hungatella hathewayi]